MVEHNPSLDLIFQSLADPTRRDIIRWVSRQEQTISQLAVRYKMSFAAVAKHVGVLQRAQLVRKIKQGKEQLVTARPETIRLAEEHLRQYEQLWNERFDKLDSLLKE